MSSLQYTAEEAAEQFLRDLDEEVESEEFLLNSDSEESESEDENSSLVLLSELANSESVASADFEGTNAVSARRRHLRLIAKSLCMI